MAETQMHPAVKLALDAWQSKDLSGWLSRFTDDAKLFDDGNARDFKAFSAEIGTERFTRIDKVEDDGMRVLGRFHSDRWGDFKTYFRFNLNAAGKFDRLDIGQANY